MSFNEKSARTRHTLIDVCATVTRLWQWGSALFITVSVTLLFHETRAPSFHATSVRPLALLSLGYSTLVIVCVVLLGSLERLRTLLWHVFALVSIPGDLLMLSVFVAKVAVLSIGYFECSVLSKTNNILTLVGGAGPDPQCYFPKGIYSLCIVAIVSYILSIIITALQLWRYRRHIRTLECGSSISASATPAATVLASSTPSPRHSMVQVQRQQQQQQQQRTTASFESRRGSPHPSRGPAPRDQDPKYANMPAGIIASMAVGGGEPSPRTSTSSFNPELYLITDGFTRPEDPPAYTSRPSSVYGGFIV